MGLVTLKEILSESIVGKYAVGAFDALDDCFADAIIQAAEKKRLPVIIMIPHLLFKFEGFSSYLPMLLDRCRHMTVPACLHLDHRDSFECCIKAIRSGCSSVMFDGSTLPIEENIAITKKVVEVAHVCGQR